MALGTLTTLTNESDAPVLPTGESSGQAYTRTERELEDSLVSVREINDLTALAPYAANWNGLLRETPGASYFHSYDWFASFWRHCAGDQQMRVLLVLADGRLVGVVPLITTRVPTRVGRLRSLTYPLHAWGSFYGPIGAPSRFVLRHALRHVLASPRDWDLLDLPWVDREGGDQFATAGALQDLGLAYRTSPWLQSAQVELSGGWQQHWAGRTTHFRTNLRRDERRLRERGEISYVRHRPMGGAARDDDPRWDLYDACERIAAQSWQGSSTTGTTMSHEAVRGYLRAAHAAAAAFGGVDINLLLLNGQPAAFAYNYQYAGYVYGLRAGFDPDVCPSGAGSVLMRMMIEDSCSRGDQVIDLGPGSLEAKRRWQTRLATAWRYTHFSPRSPRAQVLRTLHSLKAACGRTECR